MKLHNSFLNFKFIGYVGTFVLLIVFLIFKSLESRRTYPPPPKDFNPKGKAVFIEDVDGKGGLGDFNFGDIVIIDLETKEKFQITSDKEYDEHPYWSPDGMQIVFESKRLRSENPILGLSRESHLYIVDIMTGKIEQLDKDFRKKFPGKVGRECYTPAWCPTDENLFAFVTKVEEGFKIVLYDKSLDTITDLVEAGIIGLTYSLRWSRDGKYLAFDTGVPSRIGFVNIQTKEIVKLPRKRIANYLGNWDLHSKSIIYENVVSDREIWIRQFYLNDNRIVNLFNIKNFFYAGTEFNFVSNDELIFIGYSIGGTTNVDIYKLRIGSTHFIRLTEDGHAKEGLLVYHKQHI